MKQWVKSGHYKGHYSCCGIESTKGALGGLVPNGCELECTGKDQRKVLIKDDGVEEEVGSSDEGYPHVSPEGIVLPVAGNITSA